MVAANGSRFTAAVPASNRFTPRQLLCFFGRSLSLPWLQPNTCSRAARGHAGRGTLAPWSPPRHLVATGVVPLFTESDVHRGGVGALGLGPRISLTNRHCQ